MIQKYSGSIFTLFRLLPLPISTYFYIISIIVAFPIPGITQPLNTLLQEAHTHNPQLKALHQEYLAAMEKGPQVGELPDPEIGAGVFVLHPETRVGPQRLRIGASQMFPWKGTLKARENVVLAMAKAKYERVEAVKLDLSFQVKKAYFQLYELEKSQDIAQRNLRIFKAMNRLALAKVESGKGSTADVLRVQLKTQELEKELELLENQKNKPLAALNQVLNRPLNTEVIVQDSLEAAVIPFDKDTLATHIRANHPMLKLFSRQQEVSQKAIELNRLDGMPSFGAGLDYIMVGKRDDVDVSGNGKDILMPRISVKVPIYRKKYGAKQREEELKIMALDSRKEDAQVKFLAAIEQAYANQEDALLRLELYKDLIRTTQAVIDVLETEYSTTGRNFDELLRLQIELVNYDLKILKAIVKSQMAKAEIERFL